MEPSAMPEVKWEWRIGPGTILQLVQLVAIIVAIFGGFMKMQSDLEAQHETITQLQTIVKTVSNAQLVQAERVTRVETKVDLILPTLQDILRRLKP